MGGKFHGFRDAFCPGSWDIDAMASVMVGGSSDVPAVDTMWVPSAPVGRSFVDEDLGAQWGKRGSVVIEGPIELGLRGQTGIDARCA